MSITTVYFQPHVWSPAYNPIVYSVLSNQNTQTDFSYVFDIWINETGSGDPTYTIKQRPNPAGAGMLDVSSIVQPFVELTNYALENDYNNTWYRNAADIAPNILLKVGEEYSVNGILTEFNGTGSTGAPAYQVNPYEGNYQVRAIPAALPWQQGVNNMADTNLYTFWSTYVMDGNGRFLKKQGNNITVFDYDYACLAFLNWNDLGPNFAKSVQMVQYKQYSASGSLLRTDNIQNTTGAGGGPQSAPDYTVQTYGKNYSMLYVKTGPENLRTAGLWNSSTAYYTVQALMKASSTTSPDPGIEGSEIVTYTISDECLQMYPRVRLSWLNDLGGRDYWNFTKFYEKTTNSPDSKYFQTPLNWSATKPVATTGDKTENWLRGGNKSYNKITTEVYSIQSDWLLQNDVDLLAGLAQSPQVWAYIGDTPDPVTVNISNPTYTYKNVEQTKLVQVSFDLQYTKVQQRQNM